jgi:hypothetical protein
MFYVVVIITIVSIAIQQWLGIDRELIVIIDATISLIIFYILKYYFKIR